MKGKMTIGKVKSSRLSYSFAFNLSPLSISKEMSRYEADFSVSVVSLASKPFG
jgi:hypothetical protein